MPGPGRKAAFVVSLLCLLAPLCAGLPALAEGSQPVAFPHRTHVEQYGIDCLFCHSSARKTASAGIPPVQKCMTCHRTIAVDRPEIVKLARYWNEKKPVPWNRVTELPDYTYFPHFRMVNAGIECLTCHPGIDKGNEAVQRKEFTMGFCLKCHRSRGVSIDCWTCHI